MHKIVALWAVPRSTSTAFEWMMRQRGDLDCLHEPFGEAWYQGEEPLWQRFKEGDKITPGLTLETVWEDIKKRAEQGPVFIKDFPHYINHMWDADLSSWRSTAPPRGETESKSSRRETTTATTRLDGRLSKIQSTSYRYRVLEHGSGVFVFVRIA